MLGKDAPKFIGSVAKASGIPIKTIRYYEELGLLKVVGRTQGRYRLFNSDVFARLNFIKRSQTLGLSLAEIKDLLDVHDQNGLPCDHVKAKLEEQLEAIEEQVQQLQILRQELIGLLSGWETLPEHPEDTIYSVCK